MGYAKQNDTGCWIKIQQLNSYFQYPVSSIQSTAGGVRPKGAKFMGVDLYFDHHLSFQPNPMAEIYTLKIFRCARNDSGSRWHEWSKRRSKHWNGHDLRFGQWIDQLDVKRYAYGAPLNS